MFPWMSSRTIFERLLDTSVVIDTGCSSRSLLHKDPFDRILVAQARHGLTIVTPDAHIRKYDVPTLW